MKAHYDDAEKLLASSDKHQAAFQFRLFLVEALSTLAEDHAHVGEYARATPLFNAALKLAPADIALSIRYADIALTARDYAKAKALTTALVETCPKENRTLLCARLHSVLGRALLGFSDFAPATQQLEEAVRLDPTFESGYALGKAYLAMAQKQETARIFAELVTGFGDTAAIHLEFGKAYGEADFPEQAISEFRTALAKDPTLPEAHYCLGAALLIRSGDTGFAEAEKEFRAEIALHPDDSFSYAQLGYIAMSRHDLDEAERDLSRASRLDPTNPDSFLLLGEIYPQLNRPADAEMALRNAIAVTSDPSRNHYQIRGAHYQLGRLLMQEGKTTEGKKELRAAEDLLIQNSLLDRVNLEGKPVSGYQFPVIANNVKPLDPKAQAAVLDFEQQLAPAIADSYDNIGAVAAADKEYMTALDNFQQAYTWNPELEGLDYNWARAAFSAGQYSQAAESYGRYLKAHPLAEDVRGPLGFSRFMVKDYAGAVTALAPVSTDPSGTPLLSYAYAESLLLSGSFDEGMARLKQLEAANPAMAIVHAAIGEGWMLHGDYAKAKPELNTALSLRPQDAQVQLALAQAMIGLQQTTEAMQLLQALILGGSQNAEVYRQMAKLQIAQGDLKSATANLQTASKLSPENSEIKSELAGLVRKTAQPEDASHLSPLLYKPKP